MFLWSISIILSFFSVDTWSSEIPLYEQLDEKRIWGRKLWCLLGYAGYVYIIYQAFWDVIIPAKVKVEELLAEWGFQLNLTQGSTLFDQAFDDYDMAHHYQFYCLVVSALLFFGSFVAALSKSASALRRSRYFSISASLFLFAALIILGVPNYLRDSNVNHLFAHCAPEFDHMVSMLAGDVIGTFCSGFLVMNLLPFQLCISLSLVRAAWLILKYEHQEKHQETLKNIMVYSSFISPIITVPAFLIIQQLLGDTELQKLLICFWVIPPLVLILVVRWNTSAAKSYLSYLSWLAMYLLFLGLMVYHLSVKYASVEQVLRQELSQFDTYLEIVTEIFLSNVVLGDVLYLLLL